MYCLSQHCQHHEGLLPSVGNNDFIKFPLVYGNNTHPKHRPLRLRNSGKLKKSFIVDHPAPQTKLNPGSGQVHLQDLQRSLFWAPQVHQELSTHHEWPVKIAIRHLYISHNTPCKPTKILRKHCF